MFKKILIANRGEIACRVIKTARRMGIATVAVYSDADKDALHVEMADEAVHSAPRRRRILSRHRQDHRRLQADGRGSRASGYGFLSEREAFAHALKENGLVFIGPNPRPSLPWATRSSRRSSPTPQKSPPFPGFLGVIESPEHAVQIADEIGYPVMIKDVGGRRRKGMRIAYSRDEVADGFARAKSEAKSSFGDDRVFIEKFIVNPRHIEIQVLGDKHGNVIYLGNVNVRSSAATRR